MSKYDQLWKYIGSMKENKITLTFEEIEKIALIPVDHSFLNYKKDLCIYGYSVKRISLKDQCVVFVKDCDVTGQK